MMASLIHVLEGLFVAASILNGLGASLLWTAGGAAITNVSTEDTRGRNSGVFWALLQLSLVGGALSAMFLLSPDKPNVSPATAQELYAILTGVCAAGCSALLFIGDVGAFPSDGAGPFRSMVSTLAMGKEKSMLLVSVLILYSGFGQSFWQGQYPLIVGNKDQLVPLPETFGPQSISYLMIAVCAGEVIGCILLGKLSDYTLRRGHGRRPIILLASVLQAAACVLIYINMIRQLFTPVPGLAFFYGFLLGFADSA